MKWLDHLIAVSLFVLFYFLSRELLAGAANFLVP